MSVDPVFDTLRRAFSDLTAERSDCALVGGLAVSARAEVRITRDVNLAVVVDDDEAAEQLVARLRSRGYSPRLIWSFLKSALLRGQGRKNS